MRRRVQLDLLPEEIASLDDLTQGYGLRSRADAVRTALGVLEWIRTETATGRQVVAVGDNFVSRLMIPGLTKKEVS